MSFTEIFLQVVIAVVVVGFYHLWAGGRKQGTNTPVVQPPVAAPLPQPQAPPIAAPVPAPVAPAPAPVAAQVKAAPVADAITPEILAVIAAAVAVVLGRPHKVVAVQQAAGRTTEVNVWALEGRVEQFLSHRVR